VIDLHLHTTASDGMLQPDALVRRAVDAGLRVLSVTDHDTTAALAETAPIAVAAGLSLVPGIEITAVWNGRDVHVLGYFLDQHSTELVSFLEHQRADRIRRVRAIGARLEALGAPVDVERIVASAGPGRAIGRPQLALALVREGHVADSREAFDRFIAYGQPAYVPRSGALPGEVVRIIRQAGGISSLAHPGVLAQDHLVPALVRDGLDAVEAYHSDHSAEMVDHYLRMADSLGIAVSGGSDYHGDVSFRPSRLGEMTLPEEAFAGFLLRARPAPRD
jgi:3',5'-nucleoside bisphosphate phosphatase